MGGNEIDTGITENVRKENEVKKKKDGESETVQNIRKENR